jgi:DHA3 family macrolide efflux protein-like MFS transporter
MTVWLALSLGYLTAGPLADQLFGPLLVADGPLADSVGRIIGVGPGRGLGLLFIVMGLSTVLVTIAGYLHPRVRLVEQELPDAIADVARPIVRQQPAHAAAASGGLRR